MKSHTNPRDVRAVQKIVKTALLMVVATMVLSVVPLSSAQGLPGPIPVPFPTNPFPINWPSGCIFGWCPPSTWSQYRKDVIHSGLNSSETKINLKNVGTLAVKWSDTTYASGNSSPAVVFDGAFTGAPHGLYVGTNYGTMLAYDADGVKGCSGKTCSPQWSGSNFNNNENSSPAVYAVVVPGQAPRWMAFIAGDIDVEAYDAKTGALVWTGTYGGNSAGAPIISSPAYTWVDLGNGVTPALFVGSSSGFVYAFDVRACMSKSACSPTWTSAPIANAIKHPPFTFSSPAVQSNRVIVAASVGPQAQIVAFDATTGKISWVYSELFFGWDGSSPAVYNGVVYVGVTGYDANGHYGAHYLYALDANNGNLKWRYTADGAILSSPAISADGLVYFGTQAGSVYGIDASSGSFHCSASLANSIGYSSPSLANNVLYIGDEGGNLDAFDASKCKSAGALTSLLNLSLSAAPIESSPTVANGMVYLEAQDGLFALAP